jgi:hypothetical protein
MEMGLKFIAKIAQSCQNRIRSRLPKSAEAGSLNPIRQFFEEFQISLPAGSFAKSLQDL